MERACKRDVAFLVFPELALTTFFRATTLRHRLTPMRGLKS